MPQTPEDPEHYSEAETIRRREAALKRMMNTPHKPHSESAPIRKGKRKKAAKKSRKTA